MQNQRTSSQKALSRLMTIVCILFLCMTVFSLPFLPEYIAIQWRGAEPVNYASRWFILVLPGTALALFPHTSISLSSVIISECLLSLVVYFLVLIYRHHR